MFDCILTHSRLFDTGEYSDLTITCGQDTYKVHKAIVCKRCDFFKRAISFGGKVRLEVYLFHLKFIHS